ncbi:polysaccharide biosynthesis/export family protein [Algoriphagus sp. D3-2-R+10]|uniref:polysaccharide biosynthesis/export family protein n=1 Tax=Algoriphagus aurantiacus TaxID=3103948 RepID=UPI002B3D632C|nr:polysaccharide biosynthesis/export family protein [Algoriphagus sp. D3-2-R+10]MEB2777512.1 polysaccharide biosynthesis/export family protein [Algoriphagus sp. D3-2-R+10]
MRNKITAFICLFIVLIISFSCVSNKKVIFMQELEESTGPLVESSKKYPYQTEDYFLQINDIVEINIKTTDPNLNLIFGAITNESQNNAMMGGGQGAGDAFFMNGYTISDKGLVEIPLIGEVRLLGLTTDQAKVIIENEVLKYVNKNEFFVRVRLGGIRFSALGEFTKSGKYTILQNRVTIFEAIAYAGDLNNLAKRDEILLVRQYPDGSQIHKINLLDRELLGSEFYILKPNDLIYAEPMKVKEIGAGNNLVETVTLLTSSITAIALILTLVRNN